MSTCNADVVVQLKKVFIIIIVPRFKIDIYTCSTIRKSFADAVCVEVVDKNVDGHVTFITYTLKDAMPVSLDRTCLHLTF